MKKEEIIKRLRESYQDFTSFIQALSPDEYEYAPEGKWSAGQQALHLIKSTRPVAKGLGYPKFLIKYKFGRPNRTSRTFEQLVARYKEKLSTNTKPALQAYVPQKTTHSEIQKLIKTQEQVLEKLVAQLDKWTEEQLDQFIFPHPLLGKVTIREMLYFTIYHPDHHHNIIKLYLKGV